MLINLKMGVHKALRLAVECANFANIIAQNHKFVQCLAIWRFVLIMVVLFSSVDFYVTRPNFAQFCFD